MKKIQVAYFLIFFLSLSTLVEAKKISKRLSSELKIIYQVSNNDTSIKNGFYEEYFQNKLLVKGNYQNNQKSGNWELNYPNGKKHIIAVFENNKKQGQWKYFHQNGNLKATINFKNGLKSGTWVAYNLQGNKTSIANYQADSLFGEQVQYHENNEIAIYKTIGIVEGKKQISISKYYDNAKLFESYVLIDQKIDGDYKKYHPSGIIWEDFTYQNGDLILVNKMQNATGKKLFMGSFREGNGELFRYHGNGLKYSQENYKNGKLYGKALYFIDNVIRIEGFYFKGKPMGTWKYFSEYKKLLEERIYFGLNDYQYVIEYGISGEERFEGEEVNGLKTGTWKEYNFYGDMAQIASFHFGELNGEFKRFDGNIILEKGGYFYGEKVGRWQTFNKSDKVVYEEVYTKSVSFDTTSVQADKKPMVFIPSSSFKFSPNIRALNFISSSLKEDEYINQYINLPNEAEQLNVKGTVIAHLYVNEFGAIEKIKIQRGIGFGCDKEVKRVLNLLPHYEPALFNGMPKETILVKEFTFGEDL